MICISIAQESRRMALADMLNASRQCDLLEVRLDRFEKTADIGELLSHKPKPIIFSCRRPKDGGDWAGTEEERLTLLRQCIVSKADYVEIELDVADQIRKFPPAKRVISYTNLQETPTNIAEIYEEAQSKHPDVIKLTTLARTPEEAWPLVQILAKPPLPTVVVGLGKPGVMLNVLGRKIGAPWVYAALEKGMEAYPGQPTVRDMREVYHYDAIGRSTRLLGVTGFGEREYITCGVLNAALAHLEVLTRCLPLGVGSVSLFRKIMDAVKVVGVVVGEEHRTALLGIATELDAVSQESKAADLLLSKDKAWLAYNTIRQAGVDALESTLAAKAPSDKPLQGRMVMVLGVNATARALAPLLKERGGVIIIASHNKEAARQMAQTLECRHVLFEALYSTMHDVLVVCDDERNQGKAKTQSGEAGLHASYLRPGMTVMDLTSGAQSSHLLREAIARGCNAVSPRHVLREQLGLQLRLITGKEVSRALLDKALASVKDEYE
jgi:3-dehydroquinate dehydratase/shikimate dehydrogenase